MFLQGFSHCCINLQSEKIAIRSCWMYCKETKSWGKRIVKSIRFGTEDTLKMAFFSERTNWMSFCWHFWMFRALSEIQLEASQPFRTNLFLIIRRMFNGGGSSWPFLACWKLKFVNFKTTSRQDQPRTERIWTPDWFSTIIGVDLSSSSVLPSSTGIRAKNTQEYWKRFERMTQPNKIQK